MQAPTDNLYKFLAISGLICLLFFYFDYGQRKESFQNKKDEWLLSALELNSTMEASSRELKVMEQRFETFGSSVNTVEERKKEWDAAAKFLVDFNKVGVKVEPAGYRLQIVHRIDSELKDLYKKYIACSVVSFLVFIIGLILWYFKTQRYLDIKEATVLSSIPKSRVKDRLPKR